MSENISWFEKHILPWLHTSGTYEHHHEKEKFEEKDNIWSDLHLFDNHWITIQERLEWYESPKVPRIYKDHKYIFKQNMDMSRPFENWFMQNKDSGEFESTMEVTEDLPSDKGKLKIVTNIGTMSPPSGENDFCSVEYLVETQLKYKMPKGVSIAPRFLAYPLNRFFKWAFVRYVGEEIIDRDGEYARERTTEYFQYLRKYHGEEPTQTKTRQAEFKPVPEEGIFFQ